MNLEKGETSIFIAQADISNREGKQGWGSRWCKVQVSGEEREGGIRGTGVGIFECEGEWVIIQDREKGGISKNVANPHLPFNLHVNVGDSTFFFK